MRLTPSAAHHLIGNRGAWLLAFAWWRTCRRRAEQLRLRLESER
jgi:hypothetical protein